MTNHESGHATLAGKVDQQIATGCEVEHSIADDRESRRLQNRSDTKDIATHLLDIPLIEIEEMAAAAAAPIVEHQHRLGAFPHGGRSVRASTSLRGDFSECGFSR